MTAGLDRGVTLPLPGRDYQQFEFSEAQDIRLLDQKRHKKRRQTRRDKGSADWKGKR
ncbi:MAG: hypothetical protein R8K48_07850 [Gallionella sp.]